MTPLLGVVGLMAVGLQLNHSSSGERGPRRWVPWLALVVGATAVSGPVENLSMRSLPAHMVGHVVVMFLVPMFLVASGALADSVGGWRRLFARHISSRRAGHVRRAEISLWTATLALNSVMVASHIPLIFNMAMSQPRWMQWVVEPAFVASGCWFFSGLLSAPHQRLNSRLRVQAAAVIITMVEMLVMAMAMSIFTRGPWYHMTGAMGAMKMSLADQQLAAAILWICGDFWAVPLLVMVIRRAVERDGSLLALLDRRVTAR